MQRLVTSLFAILLAASFGIAYAAPTAGGHVMGTQEQAAPPKDCKKDPNDPRCKDGKVSDDPQQAAPKDCKKDPNDPRCKDGK